MRLVFVGFFLEISYWKFFFFVFTSKFHVSSITFKPFEVETLFIISLCECVESNRIKCLYVCKMSISVAPGAEKLHYRLCFRNFSSALVQALSEYEFREIHGYFMICRKDTVRWKPLAAGARLDVLLFFGYRPDIYFNSRKWNAYTHCSRRILDIK